MFMFREQVNIMNKDNTKYQIIDQIDKAIEQDKFPFFVEEFRQAEVDEGADVFLRIKKIKPFFAATVMRNLRTSTLVAVQKQTLKFGEKGHIVFTDYVTPHIGKLFRDHGIQFIDTCGNAFINHEPYYVFIIGNKAELTTKQKLRPMTGKMTTTAGLKVLFALLDTPGLINKPYRAIAQQAGVALGGIPQVINNLKEEGFIAERKGNRRLLYKDKLLTKWIEHYPAKLRDKQKYGQFTAPANDWWQDFPMERYSGEWGGETGAAILHNYLTPEIHTAYLPKEEKINFYQAAQLKPDREANRLDRHVIELIEPFWPQDNNQTFAPLLVIYADLIQTGEARNIEAAKLIYKDYLVGHLDKD